MIRNATVRIGILAVALLLAACAGETTPSRFYLLSSLPPATTETASNPLAVGVGPIALPDYLKRPQMVTRASPTELQLAEFDRWGEPLEKLVARVMVENLSALLATDRVYALPRRRTPDLDRQVEVQVFRFEADAAGTVTLTVRWSIYGRGTDDLLRSGQTTITDRAAAAGDAAAIATAMSRALESFSRTLAAEIRGRTAA